MFDDRQYPTTAFQGIVNGITDENAFSRSLRRNDADLGIYDSLSEHLKEIGRKDGMDGGHLYDPYDFRMCLLGWDSKTHLRLSFRA
jgi:hypothetical protein